MALPAPIDHHSILGAMLAPALLMAATGSLLVSANARLARVVDRLRALIVAWENDAPDRSQRDLQIQRHRTRAAMVLRACRLLYAALGAFVGTSLALAADALLGYPIVGAVPTVIAVAGMLCLLLASIYMGREVGLSVKSFDEELDQEMARRRG